ncbi:hypothetical protein LINPERHAP2_LOCUS45105 [Linum perenne]
MDIFMLGSCRFPSLLLMYYLNLFPHPTTQLLNMNLSGSLAPELGLLSGLHILSVYSTWISCGIN